MDRWFGREERDPLARARLAGLSFSMISLGVGFAQMDHALPLWRVLGAYAAILALSITVIATYLTGRSHWYEVVLAGPLVVVGGQALAVHPAAIGIVLGVLSGQTIYGTLLMSAARTLATSAGLVLLTLSPALGSTERHPLLVILPAVAVVSAFSVLLRGLHNSLTHQQDTMRREALLTHSARVLLGVTNVEEPRLLASGSIDALCRLTPGLWLVLMECRNHELVVQEAFGFSGRPPIGQILPPAALWPAAHDTDPGQGRMTMLTPAARAALAAVVPGDQPVYAAPWGISTEQLLVIGGLGRVRRAILDVVEAINAQLCLAEDNCATHAELLALAHHDPLTEIANRGVFLTQLRRAVESSAGLEGRTSVLAVDLDDFKIVNDTLGHAAGDAVLVEVARRMVDLVGDRGIAARFGGDEFAVLLPDVEDLETVQQIAARLRDRLIEPIEWQGERICVGASIGVMTGRPGHTGSDLLRCADVALYSAKALGKNQVVRFTDTVHSPLAAPAGG